MHTEVKDQDLRVFKYTYKDNADQYYSFNTQFINKDL